MVVLSRRVWTAVAGIALITVSCGAVEPTPAQPSATTTVAAATTTAVTSTTVTPPELVTRCGAAEFPLGTTEPLGETIDEAAQQAFDQAGEAVAEEWFVEGSGFGGGWTWVVVERDDRRMVFVGSGSAGFADVVIERDGDIWKPIGWGGCDFLTASAVPGLSAGAWVTDPDGVPDAASSMLPVLVMERDCAGGQAPEGREIRPVVFADEDALEIIVLIEPVSGFATCPSNPWYATTLDLGEPLGDRTLVDGHVTPGLVRPWPPTQTSLDSGGEEE